MTSNNSTKKPLVSIVVLAYNEEGSLPEAFTRLNNVMETLPLYNFEVLLIDNYSEDRTSDLGKEYTEEDDRWRYIRFSRNFGAEASVAAGLHYSKGDALIYLPADMQEPPEAIPVMLEKWCLGYDVVYGEIVKRSDASVLKTVGAKIAYKMIYLLSDIKIPPNATDFRLIARPVIEALKRCDERNRYLRGLVYWSGFRQCSFPYEREPRKRGESDAGLIFCLYYAMNALVAFSTKPLQLASIFGMVTTFASALGALVYVLLYLLVSNGLISFTPPPPGWTTMFLGIMFFGGLQSLFIGILGQYLSNTYTEVKKRPLWVLYQTFGFSEEQDPMNS